MIEQHARIVAVEGDRARIQTENQGGCNSCSVKSGCGSFLIAQMFPERNRQFLELPIDHLGRRPRPGERVVIGIDEGYLQKTSLLLYAFPLVALLLGAILGESLSKSLFSVEVSELGAILGSLSGLGIALTGIRMWVARADSRLARGVRILRIDPARTTVAIRDLGIHA